ncbi:MAG: phenylacetic acid degradation bifunctional protein PaaZ [Acidimicrobiales bacterium]
MLLESYASGSWYAAPDEGRPLADAVTGEEVARISAAGLDVAGMLAHARRAGGPALRALTFPERAALLKALAALLTEQKDEFYALSTRTGATRQDSAVDIDGGIGTLFVYSSKGRRELPDDTIYLDGPPEALGKRGTFVGQHVYVSLRGAAVHINAFNFPVWGMLEKLAPALLAGIPCIVKPASQTAYLTELVFRRIVESGLLPEGSVQLLCGPVGDLFEHLGGQDVVAFTGSAATARALRAHPAVTERSTRFSAECDSLNCSILGPDAVPGTDEFDLYVGEVVREMTVKAGQKCTAIRRAFVPSNQLDATVDALADRLAAVRVGNPADPEVTMGALASLGQREEVRGAVTALLGAGPLVVGALDGFDVAGADPERGAFLPPLLLRCGDPERPEVHDVEAFGPVSTVIPYESVNHVAQLAALGRGSLVGSVFTHDDAFARDVVVATAAHHGRLLLVNRECARESTGHGSPLPNLVHGGPGRAGGGEELGGIRGVLHYMQRTALQGSPATLTAVTGRWTPGSPRREMGVHPFRRHLEDLRIGDSVVAGPRTVTLDDIERFAELTGDTFYAHMDEEAAAAHPFFGGRVAHGYFVVSAAAGLFVDPAPGPVLANYGLEGLRFTTPVHPGDALTVALTCKQITPRADQGWGEVRWDVDVTNQDGESVARYDILTLVATRPV